MQRGQLIPQQRTLKIGIRTLPSFLQEILSGKPQRLLPMKLDSLKLPIWVLCGILPVKLLYDRFRLLKKDMVVMLLGILPDNEFLEKSRDTRFFMFPMLFGMDPVRRFRDRFNDWSSTRLVISIGISPDRMLFERSILLTKKRVASYVSSLPFVAIDTLS
ncbi:aspartyl/glutamyl-tRNA(Asn/Gln) amidotransferasesubunit B [Striga asiatica]|uniref:Aspartyl/glutamyl-tRNA(Asn/Gln) amidotransferasesubunit B n=1 Tax=Striga asiatica TaxID=4170 RepID=A0A5A7QNK9_STRAF|nr:aspartyl/glutamyl-tRNA(Asn/Gln) amidotransferasesubunit B [Striga asiatica]